VRHVFTDHIGFPVGTGWDNPMTPPSQIEYWEAESLPFGEVVNAYDEDDPLLRYPGQWQLWEDTGGLTNLFQNGYRWYNPGWGRYTQSDPIGIVELNPYAYVGNNPVNDIDPSGEASCLWWLYKCASRERDCSDFWRGEIACMTLEERVDLFQRAEENAGKPINSEFAFLLWFCHETLPECQKMWDSCPRFILKPMRHRPQSGR